MGGEIYAVSGFTMLVPLVALIIIVLTGVVLFAKRR
jgi:hypothetical protein